MNLMITGAGGFIGAHLVEFLGKKNEIISIDSFEKSNSNSNSFNADLTDEHDVKKLINEISNKNIDGIIHLASVMVSTTNIDDLDILKDNIAISRAMVLIAKIVQPKFFINFSSMAIYPNITGLFSEDSLPGPEKNTDCIYGLSKYCSEVIIDFLLRDENIRIIHLRLAQVHGKGMREDRIIPVMRKELKKSNTIIIYGNGERESNFIEIKILTECVEFFLYKETSGIYNLGDQNLSYYDLAKIIVEQYGNEESTIVKQHNGSKEKFILNLSKYKKLLNA